MWCVRTELRVVLRDRWLRLLFLPWNRRRIHQLRQGLSFCLPLARTMFASLYCYVSAFVCICFCISLSVGVDCTTSIVQCIQQIFAILRALLLLLLLLMIIRTKNCVYYWLQRVFSRVARICKVCFIDSFLKHRASFVIFLLLFCLNHHVSA